MLRVTLAAVAALTRTRWIWAGSMLTGVVGAILFIGTLVR